MSAHVLLNLSNELGKRDKMRDNNTRARMLDSIYHMKNTLKSHFWRKNVIILLLSTKRCFDVITFLVNLYCMALFHFQTRRHTINVNI